MPDDRFPAMAYWARVTLTVAGALVLLLAAWRVRNVLLLVLVAAVLAVGLDPQVRWLQRRRLSRGWAVTVILLLSVGLLVLFGWLVIPAAVRQTQALARHTPDYLDRLQHATGFLGTLENKYDLAQQLRETTARIPALALRKVPGVTASAGSIIFNVLTVAVLTIYFLVGLPRGQAAATALLAGQRKHADRNVRILEESLGRIGRYVSGNIVISIIAGTLAFVVLEILRVPFAAALGFWVAIADLIPSVGATLGAVLCVIVALFSSVADGSSSIMTGTWTRTPRRPATRQDCDLEHLSLWAQQEGITVVGTAICQDLPTLAHWGSGCRPAPTGRGIRSRGGRTR